MRRPIPTAEHRLIAFQDSVPGGDSPRAEKDEKTAGETENELRDLRRSLTKTKMKPAYRERIEWYEKKKGDVLRDYSEVQKQTTNESEIKRLERVKKLLAEAYDTMMELQMIHQSRLSYGKDAEGVIDPVWDTEEHRYEFTFVPKTETVDGVVVEREGFQINDFGGATYSPVAEVIAVDTKGFKEGELEAKLHELLAGPLQAFPKSQKQILSNE